MTNSIRLPPQNIEAERGVLGSMLFLPDAIDEVESILKADDFYSREHTTLFRTISEMNRKGCKAIDAVTLAEALQLAGKLESIGGMEYLGQIVESVPHAAHGLYYARIVREKARLRSVIYLTGEIQRQAYDADDAEELIAELDSRVSRLADLQADDEIQTARQAVDAMLADRSNPRKIHRTGISQLDTRLRGGLRDGQVVVVGGRPGAGKSVLLVQIATGIATAGTGESALIVTLEMLKQEICERLSKTMTGDEIAGTPLLFIDSTSDLETIMALCRVACRRHRVGVIVLDYLQLCEVKVAKGENRERQIATMSRRLKRMANSLRVPVVVGSQLNRASTAKSKPSLADLRESGAIEQDGDIVLLLSNDDTTSDTLIQVAKQRGGPTSEFTMRLNGPQFRFEGVEESYEGWRL